MSQWLVEDRRTPAVIAHDRAIAWTLAGLLFVAYLITYTGIIQSSDGLAMFATAESLVRRGEIDSNQLLWMGAQQGNIGPDGELYSRKGIGMTLLAMPLVWLALVWPSIGLVHAALLLNPILTAWTGGLVYLTARRTHIPPAPAALTALAFGLGTLAWPYTQTFFSDPVCMWGLFGAAYGLLAHAQTGRKRYLFAAGLAWSLAYLARVINLITLPLYALALLAAIVWATNPADLPTKWKAWRSFPRWLQQEAWRPLITFSAPVVLAGLFSLYWNWVRYGNIWDSGYVETERFDAVWWFGIIGLLAGPARGFFWYSPILLLALWGGVLLWRSSRAITLFCLLLAGGYVLLYAKWYMWHGGYSWGPRFLVPILPFLALLAGPALEVVYKRRSFGLALVTGILFLLSLLVQLLGLLVPFGLVQNWLDANIQPLFAPQTFTRLDLSPLVLQWQFLQPEHFIIFWLQPAIRGGWNLWLLLSLLVLLFIAGILLAMRLLRTRPYSSPLYETRPRRIDSGDERLHQLWQSAVRPYILALALVAVMQLVTVYAIAGSQSDRALAQRITAMEQPGDAILHLRPQDTQNFANTYHGRLPVFGHLDSATLDTAQLAWQQDLAATYRRIWVVAGSSAAEQSGWEINFRTEDFLLYDFRPSLPEAPRLALFAPSRMQPLQEAGLGTIFGDPNRLAGEVIDASNGWFRLSGYGLTPEAQPGGELLLALRWETLQPVDYDYHVFVHLLNQSGERLAQRDGQPVQWLRPTSSWQAGEEIVDRYGLLLSSDLEPGEYMIAVGLYDSVSGQRLPVSAGPSSFAIELGPVVIR